MAKSRIQSHTGTKIHPRRSKRRKQTASKHPTQGHHRHRASAHGRTFSRMPRSPESLSRSAAHLIDQAADLIKQGLSTGIHEGAKRRSALKNEAFHAVNIATKNLNEIVSTGAEYIRKGIKKI
jgi:hypothetical protein